MTDNFKPNGLPLLIGSLPIDDHLQAVKIVLEYTPEIPLWVQLPVFREEGMIAQFLPGLPGLTEEAERLFINTSGRNFEEDMIGFYEEYISLIEGEKDYDETRFVLTPETAKGFFIFTESLKDLTVKPVAVKGQITGPVTLATSVSDHEGKAVFYNEEMRDAVVKLVAMKAGWQVKRLSEFNLPVIIFFDEAALAGFGSSAFIGIAPHEVAGCFEEVIDRVHNEGGMAGIHVCSNADWSVVLESSADIVSFDAYSYFEKFILYADHIRKFIESGRMIAWGIVPTLRAEDIERENAASLAENWKKKAKMLEPLGFNLKTVLERSFITPSCGTGSLSLDNAMKVLKMTKEVSDILRKEILK
jgi:methionine synthase II (cobalamin-independent)